MGIFDKIKSILSDLENSDTSSGKPSGATPATPAIPTTPVPPVETRDEATVKPSETPIPPPDNAPGAAPSGATSSATSASSVAPAVNKAENAAGMAIPDVSEMRTYASDLSKISSPWAGSIRPNIFTPGITVEEQILIDDEVVKITLLEYVNVPEKDDYIKLRIDNMTEKGAMMHITAMVVNGYLPSSGVKWNLPPMSTSKVSVESIPLSVWKLEAAGIRAIGRIDFHLSIWLPYGPKPRKIEKDITIRTSAYDQMNTELKDPGTMILDRNGVRVFGKYIHDVSRPTPYVVLYSENNSGVLTRITSYNAVRPSPDCVLIPNGQKSLNIVSVEQLPPIENVEVIVMIDNEFENPKNHYRLQIPMS
jgi:hypothetical protein